MCSLEDTQSLTSRWTWIRACAAFLGRHPALGGHSFWIGACADFPGSHLLSLVMSCFELALTSPEDTLLTRTSPRLVEHQADGQLQRQAVSAGAADLLLAGTSIHNTTSPHFRWSSTPPTSASRPLDDPEICRPLRLMTCSGSHLLGLRWTSLASVSLTARLSPASLQQRTLLYWKLAVSIMPVLASQSATLVFSSIPPQGLETLRLSRSFFIPDGLTLDDLALDTCRICVPMTDFSALHCVRACF
jgi:hypothetical protein